MNDKQIDTIIDGHELSVPAWLMPVEQVNTKHTATPWKLARHGAIVGGPMREYVNGTGQDQVAMACVVPEDSGEQLANAEFIVRACNAHDDLVAALKSVVDNWTSQFERAGHLAPSWVKDARAALAKAGAA